MCFCDKADYMLIDVDSTVAEFKKRFAAGEFKKDRLPNKSEDFHGKLEQEDYEQFEKFVETPLFKKLAKI